MSTIIRSISAQGARTSDSLQTLLTPTRRETARLETNAWIKRLRLVRYGDCDMRRRFTYRGDSLWWFSEIYLHKRRRLDTAVSTVLALDAAHEQHAPSRLEVDSDDPVVRETAVAFGRARRVRVEVPGPSPRGAGVRWPSYLVRLTATLSRLRPQRRPPTRPRPVVAAFIHTAFWQAGDHESVRQERYIGPVLDAVAEKLPGEGLACVGLGPRRNFRARRWWDPMRTAPPAGPLVTPIERLAPSQALEDSRRLWDERLALSAALTSGPDIRAAAEYRGCDLWPVLRRELDGVALVQWPWSARAMDEAAAAIAALDPGVIVTYAEAGGWGRALLLEARRRRVPSAGIQHGFIYRHWLNYLHEADEVEAESDERGFPFPDRTLLFDRYALRHLETAGRLPAATLRVTGSAGLDALSARLTALRLRDRGSLRRDHGIPPDACVAVLAAKYSEIAAELPALFAAVRSGGTERLIVKTHPAETAAPYLRLAAGHPGISVAAPEADLAQLMAIADGLVTMNSTVAIDGLVVGIPALVLGLPNNLSPFVEAGVMLGAASPAEVGPALQTLLYDESTRGALRERAAAFARANEMRADGRAADRAAGEILALAGQPS
jgi:hypothetical protein